VSVRFVTGEVVIVDDRVLTASPQRGRGTVRCEVLADSDDGQVFVAFLPPCQCSPMFVRGNDILRKEVSDA
jgi:hypothetical protein